MVSALVYMVTYWIEFMLNCVELVVMIHQVSILHKLSTLRGY